MAVCSWSKIAVERSVVKITSTNEPETKNGVKIGIFCDEEYDVEFQAEKRGCTQGLITYKRTDGSFLSFNIISSKKRRISRNGLNVEPNNKAVMDINHVFVPEISRGLKIAEFLTIKAFSVAELNQWGVIPTCSYVRDTFLKRCPEFRIQLVPTLSSEINCATETSSKIIKSTNAEPLAVDFIKKRKRSRVAALKTLPS
jgi:predicted GNAT family acetyltransferase